ncbi:hypothetical protein V8E53_007097 [Lactarius tabidus]
MRLFRALPILGSLLGASASSLDSRRPDPHPLDARDDLDLCSTIDKELAVPKLSTGASTVAGMLNNVCLCVSDIPLFMVTNTVAEDAVNIAGEDATSEMLSSLVRRKATMLLKIEESAPVCNYPGISIPTCVNGDPCGFTCMNGYTPSPSDSPTDCICAAPNIVCNGNCVAQGACPSSQATLQKRWVGSGSCTERGYGWTACGVFGRGTRAWECVNTELDLESCGGCVFPLTPFSRIGKDCTALPGVADVSCLSGECVVYRCMPGYALSRDGTHCIPAQAHISRPHAAVPEDDEDYMQYQPF